CRGSSAKICWSSAEATSTRSLPKARPRSTIPAPINEKLLGHASDNCRARRNTHPERLFHRLVHAQDVLQMHRVWKPECETQDELSNLRKRARTITTTLEIQLRGLLIDRLKKPSTFCFILRASVRAKKIFHRDKFFVQSRVLNWRRQVRDKLGVGAAFGNGAFGRIVDAVDVNIRQVSDQSIGPAVLR